MPQDVAQLETPSKLLGSRTAGLKLRMRLRARPRSHCGARRVRTPGTPSGGAHTLQKHLLLALGPLLLRSSHCHAAHSYPVLSSRHCYDIGSEGSLARLANIHLPLNEHIPTTKFKRILKAEEQLPEWPPRAHPLPSSPLLPERGSFSITNTVINYHPYKHTFAYTSASPP